MARDRQMKEVTAAAAAKAREAEAQVAPHQALPQTPEVVRCAPRLERNPRLRVL
jgi:hypothetical protein